MKLKFLTILFFVGCFSLYSQQAIVTSGGNSTGNGSVSFSVGQTFVSVNGGNGSTSEGIQNSIEIFTLSNPELNTILLEVKTYPNPSKDIINLTIKNKSFDNLGFEIYNINGKKLRSGKVTKENTQINIKKFKSGLYFLKVHQHKEEVKVFKIIKN